MSEQTIVKCDLCGETADKGTEGWARLSITISQGETRFAIPGAYWQKFCDVCPTCLKAEPRFRARNASGFARLDYEETA